MTGLRAWRPSRRCVLWLAVLASLLTTVFILPVLTDDSDGVQFLGRWLLEVWLFVGLLAWALARIDIREILTVGQRLAAVVLGAGILVAHYSFGLWALYPFSDWAMYTRSQEQVVYADLVMIADADAEADAPESRLPLSEVVPTTSPRAFLSRIAALVRAAEEGDLAAEQTVMVILRSILSEHADPAATGVEVRWCSVTGRGPTLETSCETAMTVRR